MPSCRVGSVSSDFSQVGGRNSLRNHRRFIAVCSHTSCMVRMGIGEPDPAHGKDPLIVSEQRRRSTAMAAVEDAGGGVNPRGLLVPLQPEVMLVMDNLLGVADIRFKLLGFVPAL